MQTLYIHPENPQDRLLTQAANALQNDELIIIPDETGYAFALSIQAKNALNALKFLVDSEITPLELICQNISQAAQFATISNTAHKLLKSQTSAIGFVLPATKNAPKFAINKNKSIAVRIANSTIIGGLIEKLSAPILLIPINAADNNIEYAYQIEEKFDKHAKVFLNSGDLPNQCSTLIDLSDDNPTLVRQGAADATALIE